MLNNPYEAPQELATGGYITKELHSVTVHFDDIHYSLSSGQLNGGYHHTLAVRNQQLTYQIETEKDLPGGSVANYLAQEFEQIDTPVHFSTALLTSATMTLHAYAKVEEKDTIVETIVTAGYEKTAHRAGTGYCYEERDGGAFITPGTINILVFTNKALTDSAMVKAMMTITEAKTAALQDWGGAESVKLYPFMNEDIPDALTKERNTTATGTSTDGVVLTIDTNGDVLTDAGTFSLFGGDTLAKAVYVGVQRALENAIGAE
ncbi:adenosylcobinamide amidohydrolase [Veillonella rogosae]|nr:adenosylcobinamide amidohydrolase [Veillonella rogosae]